MRVAHQPRSLAPFARPASFLSVNRRSIKSEEESPPRRRRQHLHTSPRIVTVEPDVRATINLSSSSRARTTRTTERDRRDTGEGERENKNTVLFSCVVLLQKQSLPPRSFFLFPLISRRLSRHVCHQGIPPAADCTATSDSLITAASHYLPPSLAPSPLPPTSLIVVVVSCLLQRARPRFQQSLSLAFFLRPLCS